MSELNSNTELAKSDLNIVLWGPPGSGRTWYLSALTCQLALYDAEDKLFQYQLTDISDPRSPQSLSLSHLPGVYERQRVSEHAWQFRRIPRQKQDNLLISAHTHYLHFFDYPESEFFDLSPEVLPLLKTCHLILVFLDPTLLAELKSVRQEKTADRFIKDADASDLQEFKWHIEHILSRPLLSQDYYTRRLKDLFELLYSCKRSDLYIAVCVSKRDRWQQDLQPLNTVKRCFGPQCYTLLKDYSQLLNLGVYGISSAGYLPKPRQFPNLDPRTGTLLDLDNWYPLNVEDPLFWMLEDIEKQRIASPPKLAAWLFNRYNLFRYIPLSR